MNDNSDSSGRAFHAFGRWAGLTAVLVGEAVAISLRYDAASVPASRPWHGFVAHAGVMLRVGVAIGLAVLLFAGPGWYRELRLSSRWLERPRHFYLCIAGNLAAFLCFFGLTTFIVEGDRPPHAADWVLFAGWLASGVAALAVWAVAVLPGDLWVRLVKQSWARVLAGSMLGLAASAAGVLARDQWKLLSKWTFLAVTGMLRLMFSNVVYKPETFTVGTPTFEVGIAPECSGYEGMGLMAGLLAVALWTLRREFRFPRSFVLLPVAMGLMWLANAIRITALVALGTCGYREIAVGGFHSLAGWVLFLVVGLSLIALAYRLPFFSKVSAEPDRQAGEAFDAAYLVPAMTLIATSMVSATFSPGLDRYYAFRVIAVAIAFAMYRNCYDELRLKWSWEAVAIGCGVFAFWMALERYGTVTSGGGGGGSGSPIRSPLETFPPAWAIIWVIFRVVGSVIMVPLAEELAFRGYLTRRLISSNFRAIAPGRMTWISFFVSSVLFGVLHGRWFAGTLAGMAFAQTYRRRGELSDAVLAHAVANGLIAVAVLAGGEWSLWA